MPSFKIHDDSRIPAYVRNDDPDYYHADLLLQIQAPTEATVYDTTISEYEDFRSLSVSDTEIRLEEGVYLFHITMYPVITSSPETAMTIQLLRKDSNDEEYSSECDLPLNAMDGEFTYHCYFTKRVEVSNLTDFKFSVDTSSANVINILVANTSELPSNIFIQKLS